VNLHEHALLCRRLIVSTCPLEQQPGDIMLSPEVVEFCSGALASLGGRYTGEIEFSGRSARVARRLSSSPTGAAAQLPGPAPPEARTCMFSNGAGGCQTVVMHYFGLFSSPTSATQLPGLAPPEARACP
jgi:hypothetical protein